MRRLNWISFVTCAMMIAPGLLGAAEPLPPELTGSWRILRILPTRNVTCWDEKQARTVLGTTLSYSPSVMLWRSREFRLQGIDTRELTADEFLQETGHGQYYADFAQLGIHRKSVTEVTLKHKDADITGSSVEMPGDNVLLAGRNRIIVSACNVCYEAVRITTTR